MRALRSRGELLLTAVLLDVTVPFDPSLIPDEMSPDYVHTFCFDTVAEHWKKLDRNSSDVGDHVVYSATDHFTIMVDAVLAVPKNPSPLSFDPTTMSSIAAASPAANIDFAEPPQANSMGDARTSIPIRIPKSRGAYSPSLAISYSSSGGNGWLGVGWDLAVSRVEIDSRWGVPTYSTTESPRYLVDGVEIVPTSQGNCPARTRVRMGRCERRLRFCSWSRAHSLHRQRRRRPHHRRRPRLMPRVTSTYPRWCRSCFQRPSRQGS